MQAKSRLNARLGKIALAVMLSCGPAGAIAASGQFTFVTGNVFVLKGGTTQIQASRGSEVDPGDVVVTGADGMAQLAMVDEAKLSLRSNSRLLIERYPRVANGTDGALLTLARGTLRTFTGLLTSSSRANYRMQTRVATVGIRGSGNIMNQSDDDTTTTNHTIEGSHEISSRDGKFAPIVTNPNETVQVVFGQAPKIIPTPPSLLDAGKTMVGGGSGTATVQTAADAGPPPPPQATAPVVGSNGLGFPIIDATANLVSDPLNVQNIVVAGNGFNFADQSVPGRMTLDGSALRGYTSYAAGQGDNSFSISGGTVTDLQSVVVGGGTTVVIGRWTGASSASFAGASLPIGAGGYHFGYAGAGYPAYLSDVLTGSVSYTRVAATTPTNQFGTLGQLVSSVLDVNFTARTLNATIGISMPASSNAAAGSWTLQANNVPFTFNSFVAFSGDGRLTVTNGNGQSSATSTLIGGSLEGSFIGAALNGALLGYSVYDQTGSGAAGSFQAVNGAIVFQGPAQNAAAEFRDGLVSDPGNTLAAATYIRSYATTNRPAEVTVGDAGRVAAFTAPIARDGFLAGHQNYALGTSIVSDNGFDPVTGLVWGRWSGGLSTVGGSTFTLENSSLHYIFSPTQSGPVALPLTGTAVYDMVGATRPTDAAGHVGTLNSATLDANFSARTVNASVNVGINGQTWSGVALSVPIYRDQYFSAYAGAARPGIPRPAEFVITCAPNCTPQVSSGSLDGFFTGRTGRGAGVMYNMNRISGAVAFSRRGG